MNDITNITNQNDVCQLINTFEPPVSTSKKGYFLEFIDSLGFIPSIRCLKDNEETVKIQDREGTLERRHKIALGWNRLGYGIYWLGVDCGTSWKEKTEDILNYRTLTIDLDGAPLNPILEFSIPPAIIVETSPGRYQATWVFDKPISVKELSIKDFNIFWAKMSTLFNADIKAGKATQVMRCPGFKHLKGEPYESKLIKATKITTNFKELSEAYELASKRSKQLPSNETEERQMASVGTERRSENITESNNQSDKDLINLDDVIAGKARVKVGTRHDTVVKLAVKIRFKDVKGEDLKKELERVVALSFDLNSAFSVEEEINKAVAFAEATYIKEKKKEEENSEKALQEATDFENSPAYFKYDFNSEEFKQGKYNETAIKDRVTQKFKDNLARIKKEIYCFDPKLKIWCEQTFSSAPETTDCVISVLNDVVQERDFKKEYCLDKTGKYSDRKWRKEKDTRFKVSTVAQLSKAVLNSSKIPRYLHSDFDSNTSFILTSSGVLDMDTLEVRDPEASDRLLQSIPLPWLGISQESTEWEKFLHEVFAENDNCEGMCQFMQELYGYSLSGSITERMIFCHFGGGGNGKSLCLRGLKNIAGSYMTTITPGELTNSKKGGFEKDFQKTGAKIQGMRIAIIDDVATNSVWNDSFLKSLTEPDVRAREVYEKSREVTNRCKFHLCLNVTPEPESETEGLIRRLRIIPYNRSFEHDRNVAEEIEKMLYRDAAKILAWAVRGYRLTKAEGGKIRYPEETVTASLEYRKEHFKLENAIQSIYDKGSVEEDPETKWVSLKDITNTVNNYFNTHGIYYKATVKQVGCILKGKLKFSQRRQRDQGEQLSCYLVKIKPQADKPTDAIL